MSAHLARTIANPAWLTEHQDAIKAAFPKTWTHMENLNMLHVGFALKLAGVEWFSDDEFGRIMVFMERAGLLERMGETVRANPDRLVFRA